MYKISKVLIKKNSYCFRVGNWIQFYLISEDWLLPLFFKNYTRYVPAPNNSLKVWDMKNNADDSEIIKIL